MNALWLWSKCGHRTVRRMPRDFQDQNDEILDDHRRFDRPYMPIRALYIVLLLRSSFLGVDIVSSPVSREDGRTLRALTPHYTFGESLSNIGSNYSTVQQVCIPQAILGTDVLCQAKSGLGKTAVFVLTTLQQVEPVAGETSVLVMCHTRELAYQIKNEYARFSKYMPEVKTAVFYGGTPIVKDAEILKNRETHPHIIVATPGRLQALVRDKHLRLGSVKVFVLDECDKMLDQIGRDDPLLIYI